MTWLIVVGCGKLKAECSRPAGEMYRGSLFRAGLAYARAQQGATIRIASAKYGLLDPATVISPYDVRLGKRNRREFQDRVKGQLIAEFRSDLQLVTVLAGWDYVFEIEMACRGRCPVQAPLRYEGLGARLRWFKQQRELHPERYPGWVPSRPVTNRPRDRACDASRRGPDGRT